MLKRILLAAAMAIGLSLIQGYRTAAQEQVPARAGEHGPEAHPHGETTGVEAGLGEGPTATGGLHGDAGHGAAGGAHGEHEKAPLLPETDKAQTWYSALWVVIIFLVLLAVLYPTAWKQVLAGLKAREERIRKDIADAEAARAKAEATLREYTAQLNAAEAKVREMIASASGEAERVAAGIRTHAQQEAEEIKERANRDIEAAAKNAIAEVHRQTAELATGIAERIIRKNLTVDDQRELVNRSLEQLQTLGKN